MKTKAQVIQWLESNPTRVILVEISGVYDAAGVLLPIFYLSNSGYGSSSLAAAYQATSTTSHTVSLGSKTFTVETGKSFKSGEQVLITSGVNQLTATVTNYSSSTLIVDVTSIAGTGTYNSWTIKLDVPENQLYTAIISGGVTFSESIDFSGQPNIGYGDIELDNSDGSRDNWLYYVWANKPVTVWIGDPGWARSDFYPIFTGLIKDIDSKGLNSLNLILVNKLQSINEAVSTALMTGSGTSSDRLVPICFGECFNVTPTVKDSATLTYQVHAGVMEGVTEVRDNGAPVPFTQDTNAGTFQLQFSPFGTITATVQGAKPNSVYSNKIGSAVKALLRNYGKQLPSSAVDEAGLDLVDTMTNFEIGTYLTNRENVLEVCQRVANSAGYYLVPDIAGKLKLVRLVSDGVNTYSTNGLLTQSAQFNETQWTKTGITITADAVIAPDGTQTADQIVENNSTGIHYTYDTVTTEPNAKYIYTAYYKNVTRRYVRHSFVSGGSANGIYADIDLQTGTIVNSGQVGTGLLSYANIADVGNGWYRVSVVGSVGLSTTNYCTVTLRDSASNATTEAQQYYTGTTNSIYAWGAQLTTIYTVTQKDMQYRTLSVTQKLDVDGTVKLAYSKNWTPQTSGLASGLKPEAVAVLEKDYYYVTSTNPTVVSRYQQVAEPVAKETLLISEQDAQIEADRLLKQKETPRFVYSAAYYASLLFCELGDVFLLTYPRFGLNTGKTGIAVTINRDWLNGRANIGVFI